MGHLINPIAYRLGHSRSWEDSWFVKNVYYPEFLHSMLKIRNYIYYFWTTYLMEKKGIIFSHLNIYKFLKKLLVKIFLYNTDLEKNIYALYARGVIIFSDSFYYRYKKKRKKKEPFNYERYKPDLFFLFFLYFVYFSRNKLKRKKKRKNAFLYKKNYIKNIKKNNLLNLYNNNIQINSNEIFLKNIKEGNLFKYLKKEKKDNEFLKIEAYEKKINLLKFKKLNIGFLDFFFYIFFKINMLNKREDDIIHGSSSRRHYEMVLNYSSKIEKLIILLKIFLKTKIKIGSKHKRKRSIRNFIFFLTFFLNLLDNIKKKTGRKKIKLRDINLKLIRLFVFNKILTDFAYFYGNFLGHIISILSNINNYQFKFCHITNKSINAKFLARYIGLKLRGKFPLFYVINPIKRELKKLAKKKRIKNLLNKRTNENKLILNFKNGFKNLLTYLFNKYLDISFFYYKKFKTLITSDFFFFFLLLKKKKKNQMLLIFWKKLFKQYYKTNIWYKKKKFILNKKWIIFIIHLIKKKYIYKLYFSKKHSLLSKINIYIKHKLLINLFFGYNKYNIDSLYLILSDLKWDTNTFFFYNTEYIFLLIYVYFFSYNISNYNISLNNNSNYLIMSNYFFKSYMFYLYADFSFKKVIEYLNLNRRKHYIKLKNIYKSSSFILGYKMSFKGRFTRKQRASSIWFHQGFVPLNTFKGFIDYSFFTIPLKNSAISIKLWLYKDVNGIIWDNKFFSKMQ